MVSINLKLGNNHTVTTVIRDVYYVPELDGNLLSVSYLAEFNLEVIFGRDSCRILDRNEVVGKGYKKNSLYLLAAMPCLEEQTAYIVNGPLVFLDPELPLTALVSQKMSSEADIDIWHRRLGHVNAQSILKLLQKGMVSRMSINDPGTMDEDQCVPCLKGKQHRAIILMESEVENPRVLHRTYSDVCGPMETTVRRGYRYFVTFIDGYSHRLVVKLIKAKSEVPKLTKEYLERAKTETGEWANYFHSDGGGEYGSTSLQDYFKSKGVHHEMTNPYTPQENSISKQMNRTLIEMACAMLSDTGLPNAYWGDAILYAMHILNRVPTRALDGDLTPHEAFTGNKPSVAHLRIFGCKVHIHVPDAKRLKLDAKSIKCIFLGFAENQKAYICVQRPSGQVFELRDVVSDEGSTSGPSRVKFDETDPNAEETQPLAIRRPPKAIKNANDSPGDNGETTVDDGSSNEESVNEEPSEEVNNDENVLIHAPDRSDHEKSPSTHELSWSNIEGQVSIERQVSRGQGHGN